MNTAKCLIHLRCVITVEEDKYFNAQTIFFILLGFLF
jgi:hypothetical protein